MVIAKAADEIGADAGLETDDASVAHEGAVAYEQERPHREEPHGRLSGPAAEPGQHVG